MQTSVPPLPFSSLHSFTDELLKVFHSYSVLTSFNSTLNTILDCYFYLQHSYPSSLQDHATHLKDKYLVSAIEKKMTPKDVIFLVPGTHEYFIIFIKITDGIEFVNQMTLKWSEPMQKQKSLKVEEGNIENQRGQYERQLG